MAGRSNLPHVSIRMEDGMVKTVEIDGERLKGIKAVSFMADAAGGYPVVKLELWATVELNGLISVVAAQERHVQRCTRPHVGDDGVLAVSEQKPVSDPVSGRSGGVAEDSWQTVPGSREGVALNADSTEADAEQNIREAMRAVSTMKREDA